MTVIWSNIAKVSPYATPTSCSERCSENMTYNSNELDLSWWIQITITYINYTKQGYIFIIVIVLALVPGRLVPTTYISIIVILLLSMRMTMMVLVPGRWYDILENHIIHTSELINRWWRNAECIRCENLWLRWNFQHRSGLRLQSCSSHRICHLNHLWLVWETIT